MATRYLLLLTSVAVCFAQSTEGTRNRSGDEIEIPLPMGSPRAFKSGLSPLTAREKAALAFRNSFYPRQVGSRVLLAAWDQLFDSPSEWPGNLEGFGMRLGDRMASRAIRESIRLGFDVALRTDSRYDLCDCTTAKGRLGHAWKRVLVTRRDAGGEVIAANNLAGAFATPWITNTWLPDRYNTASAKLQSAGINLAFRGLGNTIREFWPDIARKTKLPRKFGGNPR